MRTTTFEIIIIATLAADVFNVGAALGLRADSARCFSGFVDRNDPFFRSVGCNEARKDY